MAEAVSVMAEVVARTGCRKLVELVAVLRLLLSISVARNSWTISLRSDKSCVTSLSGSMATRFTRRGCT